jgi:hypothetical protein
MQINCNNFFFLLFIISLRFFLIISLIFIRLYLLNISLILFFFLLYFLLSFIFQLLHFLHQFTFLLIHFLTQSLLIFTAPSTHFFVNVLTRSSVPSGSQSINISLSYSTGRKELNIFPQLFKLYLLFMPIFKNA